MYHSFSHIVFILAPSRLLQTQARDAYWSEQQDDEVTYSGAEKLYCCTQCLRVASCLRPKARLCVSKNNMIPFGDHSLTYGLRTKIYQLVSWDSREPTLGCSAMKDIEFASGRNWKQVCHRGRQRTQMPQSESFCSASPMISKSSASRRLGSCSPQLLLWPNPTASCLEAKEGWRETWVPRECVNTSLHGH